MSNAQKIIRPFVVLTLVGVDFAVALHLLKSAITVWSVFMLYLCVMVPVLLIVLNIFAQSKHDNMDISNYNDLGASEELHRAMDEDFPDMIPPSRGYS